MIGRNQVKVDCTGDQACGKQVWCKTSSRAYHWDAAGQHNLRQPE